VLCITRRTAWPLAFVVLRALSLKWGVFGTCVCARCAMRALTTDALTTAPLVIKTYNNVIGVPKSSWHLLTLSVDVSRKAISDTLGPLRGLRER
jgi:hypothetical protein